jgi:hypothetical protein
VSSESDPKHMLDGQECLTGNNKGKRKASLEDAVLMGRTMGPEIADG